MRRVACEAEQLQALGMGEFTRLLEAVRNGQSGAIDQIVALTYQELRELAHRRLRRTPQITLLETGALVNERYLRLAKVRALKPRARGHCVAYAAPTIRAL